MFLLLPLSHWRISTDSMAFLSDRCMLPWWLHAETGGLTSVDNNFQFLIHRLHNFFSENEVHLKNPWCSIALFVVSLLDVLHSLDLSTARRWQRPSDIVASLFRQQLHEVDVTNLSANACTAVPASSFT